MKQRIVGSIIALICLVSVSSGQQQPRYAEYWQSYSNVEHQYPTGYSGNVIHPGSGGIHVETIPYTARECQSPYPSSGVWDRYNNSVANSTYSHWGENREPYSCERFLEKTGTPAGNNAPCGCGAQPEAPVTFSGGSASELYAANVALIDDLKAMYCLPSHIIYRLQSRNDAAYNRSRSGGSPAMPGSNLERTTLSGIHDELVKLRNTCMDGGRR